MRKTIIALFVLMLTCLFSMANAESIPNDLTGDWTLFSVDDQTLSETGADFTLTRDGNAILSWNGSIVEVKWYVDGSTVIFQNDDGPMMLMDVQEDGNLLAQIEGTSYIFHKTENDFSFMQSSAETVSNASADAYIGNWSAKSIIAYGTEFNAADFDLNLQMYIADGECTLVTDGDELLYSCSYENGALFIGDDEYAIVCTMRNDGTMVFDLEEEGITMTVVMAPLS